MGKRDTSGGRFELTRRDFLKVAGAGAAAVATMEPLMPAPAVAITPDPGDTLSTYISTCPYCSAQCGQIVVLRRWLAPFAPLAVFSWWNTPEWTTPLKFPGSAAYAIGLRATTLLVAGNHAAAALHVRHGFSVPGDLLERSLWTGDDETPSS